MTREEIVCNVTENFFSCIDKSQSRDDLSLARFCLPLDWPYPEGCYISVGFDLRDDLLVPCAWGGRTYKRKSFSIPAKYAMLIRRDYVEKIVEDALLALDNELTRLHLLGGSHNPKRRYKSRAKYQKGERITSLDELMAQNFIYCFDKITHHGWFQSWNMRLADQYIKRGVLFKAVRKEECDVPLGEKDNGT